uniref:VWFD domain-containing protein n=1 Tax=Steinernema glaseri TaxID=37863 RepID=A0A1I7YHP1_9BILA
MFSSKSCTAFGFLTLAFFISRSIACHPVDIPAPDTTDRDQESNDNVLQNATMPGNDTVNDEDPNGGQSLISMINSKTSGGPTCETKIGREHKFGVDFSSPMDMGTMCKNAFGLFGLDADPKPAQPLVITLLQIEGNKVSCMVPDTITIPAEKFREPSRDKEWYSGVSGDYQLVDCDNPNGFCRKLDGFVVRYDSAAPSYFYEISFNFELGIESTFKFKGADTCCEQRNMWFGQNGAKVCMDAIKDGPIDGAVNKEHGYFLVTKDENNEAKIAMLNQKEFDGLLGADVTTFTRTCMRTGCD